MGNISCCFSFKNKDLVSEGSNKTKIVHTKNKKPKKICKWWRKKKTLNEEQSNKLPDCSSSASLAANLSSLDLNNDLNSTEEYITAISSCSRTSIKNEVLKEEVLINVTETTPSFRDATTQTIVIKSPVTILNEYGMRQKVKIKYSWVNDTDVENEDPPTYLCQASCVDTHGYGRGFTKQVAKRNAANELVEQLNIF